jgi:hypothetical protein
LRALGHAESTSLDTPAERHKQAPVKRGKNKDEEAPQRNGNSACSLDPHPIPLFGLGRWVTERARR